MKFILVYLIAINIFGIYIMYLDKRKAKKGYWRVPEATLFMVAAIFGSLGVLIGMKLFHHKTKHLKFVIGIPAILILQVYLIYKIFQHIT
ncbi:DUF1294 domain-containing protein [Candidatus Clostridium radicumherbarum]|jgi:Predicted membrane protein|uniref:DUF1294 domain-containing protein n=1 Tax=Candidatus Clostridium radicumherbarum TaxID=3381662 RepID=A0ABW8TU82_9CLOT